MLLLWIKTFHIFFMIAWFSGLFYLPRIFVNLAMETHPASLARLLQMAQKLYRFTIFLSIPAIAFGLILWLHYSIGKGQTWVHIKMGLVVLLLMNQAMCGKLLHDFKRGVNQKTHTWYRWFNEIPALILLAALILVVLKPF